MINFIAVVLGVLCLILLVLHKKQKGENLALSARCRKAEDNSVFDGLTSLYNYRFFLERLSEEMCRSSHHDKTVTILFVDLDGFKGINKAYGRNRGDELLKSIAQCLKKSIRSYDTVARYEQDEFILAMPEIPWQTVMKVAERLREKIRDLGRGNPNYPINLSACIGVYQVDAFSFSSKKRQLGQLEEIKAAIAVLSKNAGGDGIYISPKNLDKKIVR
jgi:diguanylate cyclase (GGDEF)-like protein